MLYFTAEKYEKIQYSLIISYQEETYQLISDNK